MYQVLKMSIVPIATIMHCPTLIGIIAITNLKIIHRGEKLYARYSSEYTFPSARSSSESQ